MTKSTRDITMIALFPAMMGATAGIAIPLGPLPPITLQTLFVFLSGFILGPRKGALSMFIYVLLGAIGVPVFSGFRGGMGVLLGPTGGFIISFIFVSFFVGFMKNIKIINRDFWNYFVILLIGNLLLYMFGGSYLAYVLNANYWLTISGFYVYFVGDLVKIFIVLYVYMRIRSHVTYEHS